MKKEEYDDLGKLLTDYGLSKINTSQFQTEMLRNGWTDTDIDAWCATHHWAIADERSP